MPEQSIERGRVRTQLDTAAHASHPSRDLAAGPHSPRSGAMPVASSAPVQRHAALIQQWRAWAQQTPRSPEEQRAQAVRCIVACCEGSETEAGSRRLNLSHLRLSGVLPPLPGHLRVINLSDNEITALAPFSDEGELEELDVSDNETLRALPPLPSSLHKLGAAHCDLDRLQPFPEGCQLKALILRSNFSLATLPTLPTSLEALDVSHCSIERLADFPEDSQLRCLEVYENPIRQLPPLPHNLTELYAKRCALSALPVMPPGLIAADFSYNAIHDLSHPAPHTLKQLDLRCNIINGLPEWLFQLDPQTEVSCSFGHMTAPARQGIIHRILSAQAANTGPRIKFDMRESDVSVPPTRPLGEAVAAWRPEGSAQAPGPVWTAIADEAGARNFARFIDRLGLTTNHVDPATREPFRQGVRQLLADMARSPPLREDCFAICAGATATCEDRVTLSYQKMAVPRVAEAVRRGDFDANEALPSFIDQARCLYRREVLTDIANRKAAGMDMVDPIEVHLAFQVNLNEPLGLHLEAEQMRFYDVSGVTDADLQAAEREVKQRENQGFANHLINHSGPWALLMQQRAPDLHAQMLEAKHQALENLPQALDARLAQHGLHNDTDAVREAGRTVTDELTMPAQRPFVEQFLREHANDPDALLAPRWPPE